MSDLFKRTLSGIGFIAIVIGAILLGKITYFILFLLIICIGLFEYISILKLKHYQPQVISGFLISILFFVYTYLKAAKIIPHNSIGLMIPIALLIFIFELFKKTKTPFQNISLTFLGLIYIVFPLSLINFMVIGEGLHEVSYNPQILLGMLILIWFYDSAAYMFGVTFGKHKLFPRISPKKSWEGFIGGLIITSVVSAFAPLIFPILPRIHWIIISIIIVVFGTFGDLIESLFKRSVGIKDSGKIMPGHGGILDRFDSFLFAVPAVYAYLMFFELL